MGLSCIKLEVSSQFYNSINIAEIQEAVIGSHIVNRVELDASIIHLWVEILKFKSEYKIAKEMNEAFRWRIQKIT